MQPHRQPLLTRFLIAVLRPVYRHKVKGIENIREDAGNPLIFLCNHGEFYGPIAATLYIPLRIRPWSISELCIRREEAKAYVYRYTYSPMRLPEFVKQLLSSITAVATVFVFGQLDCIPVFRNKPRELMQTFRNTAEALEAGDHLLIFPENPNATGEGQGYATEGLGPLFTGFEMIAPIYYNRTGKCCRFLPMYAHKAARTVSFGTEIVYDPKNEPGAERTRLVTEIEQQMRGLMEREEHLLRERS